MGALRIYDQDFSEDVWLPAAGVPWFVTLFGRDSLIASLQTMMIHLPSRSARWSGWRSIRRPR